MHTSPTPTPLPQSNISNVTMAKNAMDYSRYIVAEEISTLTISKSVNVRMT